MFFLILIWEIESVRFNIFHFWMILIFRQALREDAGFTEHFKTK